MTLLNEWQYSHLIFNVISIFIFILTFFHFHFYFSFLFSLLYSQIIRPMTCRELLKVIDELQPLVIEEGIELVTSILSVYMYVCTCECMYVCMYLCVYVCLSVRHA